jgi:flavin-dependent dehydrogenase
VDDVLVVGAGPAGSVAATVLARAGARVRIVDRATFPRDKLCGDTLNPGTLSVLGRLQLSAAVERFGVRLDGMLVTGEGGVAVEGRYPNVLHGRSISRRDLDCALLSEAIAAGADFQARVTVRQAIVHERRGARLVEGVMVGAGGVLSPLHAPVTIAADGRRSTLAFGLGLAHHPARPRRWAIGAYLEQADGMSTSGEMHIRRGRYIGVSPFPGNVANVCLVQPSGAADGYLRDPERALMRELAADPLLRDRFASARLLRPPIVLGPLAVDVTGGSIDGLILAGDAAGFIDPMTGDGLRFAVRGGELAALAALRALEHGWAGVHSRLAVERRREFAGKWRFNRALRALVASPLAVQAAAKGARFAPGVVRALIARAGDCDIAA